nr:hypothetical protein [uncultured Arsenicibacter sp.]
MKALILAGMVALMAAQCGTQEGVDAEVKGASTDVVIRSGTSYGFCIGYCKRQLDLTPAEATFIMKDNREELPVKSCKGTITADEWKTLAAQADLAALKKQPERIGCPDCADGGAEFLEIERSGDKYRVTFEAGKTIPGFESLVETLRKRRTAFNDCQ